MATKVLDVEFEKMPPEIVVLDGYAQALALIRLRGRPVGQAWLPLAGGRIGGEELRDRILQNTDWAFWDCWLRHYLGLENGFQESSAPPATVAVCTRERPGELRRCLEGLTRLPDCGQEIVVVDNSPRTDRTYQITRSHGSVRYVREDRPGLNAARNRALQEAGHDLIAFADDDTVPDPEWLRALLRNFDDPQVACVTGLTMPLELETEAQEWFERFSPFGRGFQRRVFDKNRLHPLAAGRVGAGANMALRRSMLEQIGPFDETLDGGTPACSGGDTEMFSRVLKAGYQIVYDPSALSWHHHRESWADLRQTVYGYGVGVYAFWTRSLLTEGEVAVLKLAGQWFGCQFRGLLRSLLRRPGSPPADLLWAELRGCAAGPGAYLLSRRAQKEKERIFHRRDRGDRKGTPYFGKIRKPTRES